MIRKSFVFLDRVGRAREKSIWQQGILGWQGFLDKNKVTGISALTKSYYDRKIIEARHSLYSGDSLYFTHILPQREHWRLYDFFREDAVYMDIEASGVSADSYITVIGLSDGIGTRTMIRNVNLDIRALGRELSRYKMIVSFNGTVFDAPFLRKRYPGLLPDIPHFDLRHACRSLGLPGGLKDIEKQLGIQRPEIIGQMYGGDPKLLWRMYLGSRDDYYLKLLVEYNEEDVMNLRKIAGIVYQKLILGLGP